ncbi:hypothetical protein [Dehalogenimonas sp. 4OHTPN]|uniref:DUF4175 domain-containing protein n=1 Tax=Dehalogenimonas sp. 4OHTPN TaxID=3166643 RepID=A0AAU8GCG7_9CHLR
MRKVHRVILAGIIGFIVTSVVYAWLTGRFGPYTGGAPGTWLLVVGLALISYSLYQIRPSLLFFGWGFLGLIWTVFLLVSGSLEGVFSEFLTIILFGLPSAGLLMVAVRLLIEEGRRSNEKAS